MYSSYISRCNKCLGNNHISTSIVHTPSTRDTAGSAPITQQQQHGQPAHMQRTTCMAEGQHRLPSHWQVPILGIRHQLHTRPALEAQPSAHQFGKGNRLEKGRPAGTVFQPCLNFILQGKISWALDLLQQLISEHGLPERSDGDSILLVGCQPLPCSCCPLASFSPAANVSHTCCHIFRIDWLANALLWFMYLHKSSGGGFFAYH